MKFAFNIFAVILVATTLSSTALAETSKKDTCPSAEALDKITQLMNLAELDVVAARNRLKKTVMKPEDIRSKEKNLQNLEKEISEVRAEVSLCQAQKALTDNK